MASTPPGNWSRATSASIRWRIRDSRAEDMPTDSGVARGRGSVACALMGQLAQHEIRAAASSFFMASSLGLVAGMIVAFLRSGSRLCRRCDGNLVIETSLYPAEPVRRIGAD